MSVDDSTSRPPGPPSQSSHLCFLCWNEFGQIIRLLSEHIRADGSPQTIIGLQRGGLIPAVCLSHQLGVRQLLSLPVSRTTSDVIFARKIAPSIMQVQPDLLRGSIAEKDVLVVDDIVGTGETIKKVLPLLHSFTPVRIRSAVCVINRENWDLNNSLKPVESFTYIGKEMYGWVVFPWEMAPDSIHRLYPV